MAHFDTRRGLEGVAAQPRQTRVPGHLGAFLGSLLQLPRADDRDAGD